MSDGAINICRNEKKSASNDFIIIISIISTDLNSDTIHYLFAPYSAVHECKKVYVILVIILYFFLFTFAVFSCAHLTKC